MPIRTCVVTGAKKEAKDLFRFTIQDGILVFDEKKKRPGRGGYVVKDLKVISALPKYKKKIRYLLRVPSVVIPENAFHICDISFYARK